MLNRLFITIAIFSMILLGSCSEEKTITKNTQPTVSGEYIILFGGPNIIAEELTKVSDEEDYFSVINISNDEMTGVPAVAELEGNIYLPTMSRMPSYYNKVVEGVFVPDTNYFEAMTDTIFRVTKHLRDTVLTVW